MFVSEIIDDAAETLATTDQTKVFRKLTQAVQILMESGHHFHTNAEVDVCTGWDGMTLTLPRGIEVPLAVNVDGSPTYFRGRLFQYHVNKGGMYNPVSWAWDDRGFVSTMMDIREPAQLVAVAEHEADANVKIRVIGTNEDNRDLRTQTEDGQVLDGLLVQVHAQSDFPLGTIEPDGVTIQTRTVAVSPLLTFTSEMPHQFVTGEPVILGNGTDGGIDVPVTSEPLNISLQPVDVHVVFGASNQFSIQASGGLAPYAYTWEKSSNKGVTWTPASSVINTWAYEKTFTATLATVSDNDVYYRCKVKDQTQTIVISNMALFSVISLALSDNFTSEYNFGPGYVPDTVGGWVENVAWLDGTVIVNGEAVQPTLTDRELVVSSDYGIQPYTVQWQFSDAVLPITWVNVEIGSFNDLPNQGDPNIPLDSSKQYKQYYFGQNDPVTLDARFWKVKVWFGSGLDNDGNPSNEKVNNHILRCKVTDATGNSVYSRIIGLTVDHPTYPPV